MNIKHWIIASVIASAVIYGAGYHSAANRYQRELAEVCAKNAQAAALAEAEYREKEKRYAEKLSEAVDKLAAVGADRDSLRADLDRVREQSQRRAVRESADACNVERAAVARCEGLLRESTGLLAEGADLLGRNAAVHDALAGAVSE